ncbi:unnamed protein product [Tuber aestivum]|uniref:Uncharacterized protein n=1 Tax=Tuber aestivum TaxID=59557 RepID=A0A292Q576_9PEZI|nr:unnamed protein product [Tuber aestivum]
MFALGPKLMDKAGPGAAGDGDTEARGDQETDREYFAASGHKQFAELPKRVQNMIPFAGDMVNPPLVGSIMAAFIGLIPLLHKAFFADTEDGGIFRAWLTSSVSNIGDLFTALQMFVVGSHCAPVLILSMNVAIPTVYYLAKKKFLGHDPMAWLDMIPMPVGQFRNDDEFIGGTKWEFGEG